MKITVMLASGDEDEWENAADAVDDRGSLVVLYKIEGDEVPGDIKTLVIRTEVEQDPPPEFTGRVEEIPTMTKSQTFQVAAQYAPGMWMKVEFE